MTIKEQLENALLGGILVNGFDFPKDELNKKDFENKINWELYNLLYEFYTEWLETGNIQENESLLNSYGIANVFMAFLQEKGVLKKFQDKVLIIQKEAVPQSLIPDIIERIKKKSAAKELLDIAVDITKKKEDPETAIEEIEQKLEKIKKKAVRETLQKVDIMKLIQEEPEPIDFVFNGLPTSSVGMLAAPGGMGKSMFILEILLAVATGKDLSEVIRIGGRTGKCSYLCLEDPLQIVHFRIRNLSRYLSPENREILAERLSLYMQKGFFELLDNKGQINYRNLDNLKRISEGQRLVVVDTLRRIHSAEENASGDMSKLLQIFEIVARETGTAFLLVHHTAKDEASLSRGSGALFDNIRYQINLVRLKDSEAKSAGIDVKNKRNFVKLINTKANYSRLDDEKILKRHDYGILKFYDTASVRDEAVDF